MPFDPNAKYRQIYQELHGAILGGSYDVGQRIPTESQLALDYNTSRPTVAKALRELEQAGYLCRRRGVGTFVTHRRRSATKLLGMILPRPQEGIFMPMADGIVRAAEKNGYGVLMSGSLMRGREVSIPQEEAFCEQLLSRNVAGVFFGPLDVVPEQEQINVQIAERLDKAGVPLILLDRDICDYPARSKFDLVGINNRRESMLITTHLLELGCRRIEFIRDEWVLSTGSARVQGFRDAMACYGINAGADSVHRWEPGDQDFIRELIKKPLPDAFVCVNDRLAHGLMHGLAVLGVRVPEDVRVVGFDDIERSAHLPSPLTTMRQPAEDLGIVATKMLLERLDNPELATREMMLSCELVVRASCGSKLKKTVAVAG